MMKAPAPHDPTILADRLLHAFAARADREQLCFLSRGAPARDMTGAEVRREAMARASLLRGWLGPGPRVLVLALPAGADFVLTLFAALLCGITVVPVSVPRRGSRSDRFGHIAEDCGAAAVLCHPGNREAVAEALAPHSACPVAVLPLDDAAGLPAPRAVAPPTVAGVPPAVIQYTSGSTRTPKGVRIMPWNIVDNCALVMRTWDMYAATRMVNWLPHYHDMGLMGGILYPVLCGGYSVQMDPLEVIRRPLAWLEAISERRADFSGGPAFAFAECLRRVTPDDVARLDLSCWRRAYCGAEPVPAGLLPALHARLAPAGLRRDALFACYGLAEMTLFAGGAPEHDPAQVETAAAREGARVHPCVLTAETRRGVCIIAPDGTAELPEGEVGEICLRGPSQGEGYLHLEAATARTFRQVLGTEARAQWLRTGDLGVVRDGLLHVIGRLKDIVIANGRKVAAAEIEWLAASWHEALNPHAAAAFMPDPNAGTRAALVIETKLGHKLPDDTDGLRQTIRQSVRGEWGIDLTEILFVPRGRLDRTSSGKIRRQAVAQAYREGMFTGA